MAGMSRREFLAASTAGATVRLASAAGNVPLAANPLGLPIGSQTYPHRALIAEESSRTS